MQMQSNVIVHYILLTITAVAFKPPYIFHCEVLDFVRVMAGNLLSKWSEHILVYILLSFEKSEYILKLPLILIVILTLFKVINGGVIF